MKNRILLLAFATVIIVIGCKKDVTPEPTCVEPISFATHVEPFIQQSCSVSGCHDAGTSSGGVNLSSYVGISNNASKILARIQLEEGNPSLMPVGGPRLPDSTIQQFSCWISQGTLNN